MSGIVELRQTGENNWAAKYQGNYGLYTIRVTMDGEKAVKFSCSCPSDYYPCKHISIIEEAIAEEVASRGNRGGMRVEELISDVPVERLREFITVQANYNPELFKAVFFEFAGGRENEKGGGYHTFLRDALMAVRFNEDDYYSEGYATIDVLDDLLDKAQDCVEHGQYDEALLICKACIEEYSRWLDKAEDISYLFCSEYQELPFKIMKSVAAHTGEQALFDYCMAEVKKKKYKGTEFNGRFHRLLEDLAETVDPDGFIALQDSLLEEIPDKNSSEAESVLWRKINFLRRIKQEDRAWDLIKDHIQIKSFCLEMVKRKIEEQQFQEAKELITGFIGKDGEKNKSYAHDTWHELLLEIAQKEKDIPAIRDLAYGFIGGHFREDYFVVYKAAFSPAEWPARREALFLRYTDGRKYFCVSAADLLAAEQDAESLIRYVEKYLSLQYLEQYYKSFASVYPEKTIALFQRALNFYAENNTGRTSYEYILRLLRKMEKIKGGKEAALGLAADYKARYKNRRAMVEVLSLL